MHLSVLSNAKQCTHVDLAAEGIVLVHAMHAHAVWLAARVRALLLKQQPGQGPVLLRQLLPLRVRCQRSRQLSALIASQLQVPAELDHHTNQSRTLPKLLSLQRQSTCIHMLALCVALLAVLLWQNVLECLHKCLSGMHEDLQSP